MSTWKVLDVNLTPTSYGWNGISKQFDELINANETLLFIGNTSIFIGYISKIAKNSVRYTFTPHLDDRYGLSVTANIDFETGTVKYAQISAGSGEQTFTPLCKILYK